MSTSCGEPSVSLGGSPAGHWLVLKSVHIMENQSARGGLSWEVYKGKYDRSWITFNFQEDLESWRHGFFRRAKRGAWQMGLCPKPQRIKRLLSHFFTSVLGSLSISLPCIPLAKCQVFSLRKHCIFSSCTVTPCWLEFNTILLQIKMERLSDVSIMYALPTWYF